MLFNNTTYPWILCCLCHHVIVVRAFTTVAAVRSSCRCCHGHRGLLFVELILRCFEHETFQNIVWYRQRDRLSVGRAESRFEPASSSSVIIRLRFRFSLLRRLPASNAAGFTDTDPHSHDPSVTYFTNVWCPQNQNQQFVAKIL